MVFTCFQYIPSLEAAALFSFSDYRRLSDKAWLDKVDKVGGGVKVDKVDS